MPIAITPPGTAAAQSPTLRSGSAANVGIKAIELYFPNSCVDQSNLEKYDGVSEGKYTIGLGQTRMSFCDDREDIYSITLTAVSSLLRKYKIDTRTIGRLEVGTETLLDKSKSVKSVLMQLFSDVNTNIVGVDNINACYGGTNALFNAVDWIESSAWDGRDAIVVAGDVAVYSHGAARPTGGAGAAAILVGPNAPVVIQPGLRGSFFQHAYDFYKADLRSEYPIVQGQYSMECYTRSLDACYEAYKLREQVVASALSNGSTASNDSSESVAIDGSDKAQVNKPKKESADMVTDRFDYMVFHSPTTKLVTKSFARLLYDDFKAQPDHPLFKEIDPSILDVDYEDSLRDKKIDKIFSTFSAETYDQCVKPSNLAAKMCGNMYTASLYSGLVSLLSDVAPEDLFGKTVGMFSYGSGLASTLFSLKVVGDTSEMRSNLDLSHRLDTRRVVAPEVYEEAIHMRENAHLKDDFAPSGNTGDLAKGTYYLTKVDGKFQRTYEIA